MSLSMMNFAHMLYKIEHDGYEINDFYCFYVDDFGVLRHVDASGFVMGEELYTRVLGFGLKIYYALL